MAEVFYFHVQEDRSIKYKLPEPIMQEDKDVATWRFRIPKVLNQIDMSGWSWWFVYVNAKGQTFSELLTLTDDIDEPASYSTADYDIDYGISKFPGSFSFALEAISTEQGGEISGEWHTKTYKHKVDSTLQGNQAEYAETESDVISALMQEVRNKVNQLVGGATPLPVNLKSLMTDHDKVYLYTGSESGESTNYWYHWNGTDFVPGGQYASGLVIDPTLSQSGQAADAKAVGEIAKLNSIDFFTDGMKKNGTSHGISYTWDNDKKSCHIVGTSDATSFVNQYANYTALPTGMVTGVDYYLKLSGATNAQCRIYKVVNSQLTLLYAPTSDMVISIPSDAEGLVIRFWCAANTTVDETVELHILNAKTNKDLTDEMDLISTNGDLFADNAFTIYSTSTANSRMHFEQDALNGVYIKILDTQFLRGQIDKNIAWDSISIEKVTSPSGVENCIFIPLNSSLVYDINENIYKIIVTNNNLNSNYIELFTVSRRNGMADIVSGKGLYLYQAWMQYMKGETLPSYWSAYMPTKIAEIQEKDTTIGNHGDSFVFITDVHWNGNAKNSPALIHDVLDNSDVSKVFHGGDIVNDDATRLLALAEMRDFMYRFKDVDFTTITGNHDWNDNGKTDSDSTKYLSNDDVYSVMFKFNERVINTEGKRYFYKDNVTQKIRYIFIDTGHTRSLFAGDTEQQTWLADILTGTESGWKIVIFTHMYWGNLDSNNVPVLMGGGTTLNNIIDTVYSEMQAEIIALVIGHTHYDYAEKSPQGFWRIATGTDDYARSDLPISPTMTKGTTTEQLFDVYHIDTIKKKIYLTRVGAGENRMFTYGTV